jgi:hypothetical protein
MCEYVDHALDPERFTGVDARYASFRYRRLDDETVAEVGCIKFAGIFGLTSDFSVTVNT